MVPREVELIITAQDGTKTSRRLVDITVWNARLELEEVRSLDTGEVLQRKSTDRVHFKMVGVVFEPPQKVEDDEHDVD